MSAALTIIDRYLGQCTLRGFLLVICLLVAIFSIFDLLFELDFVGRGAYRLSDALAFVGLTVPRRLADLMPLAGLLGSILALGLLADHHELTAMQVAGLSVRRIALAVLTTGCLLMLAALLLSEFIAPPLEQYARNRRFQAIYGTNIMLSKHGFWVRHGQLFVKVGRVFAGGNASEIEVFEFGPTDRLRQYTYARQGAIRGASDWVLLEAEATVFNGEDITQKTLPEYRIADFLSPSQVAVLELPPESLSLSDLFAYIRILDQRGQNAERYALSFWQKIALPVSTGAMVLLALSFIFGPVRMRNAWQRIFAGMLAGTVVYLSNQILGRVSLVFHLPAPLMTALPIGIVLAVGVRLLRRAA